WHFFELKHRIKGAFPTVTRVPLMKDKQRPHFWVSSVLHTAITERLARKEQTLIFLNRRGFSFFIQCAPCGFVFTCNACSVSLTYHENKTLQCHYCNAQQAVPPQCPTCKTP